MSYSRVMRLVNATPRSSSLRVTIGQVVLWGVEVSYCIFECRVAVKDLQARHLLQNSFNPDLEDREISDCWAYCEARRIAPPHVCLVEHEPAGISLSGLK